MPHTIVIFGASGDLTSRKLIPALYSLQQKGRLPKGRESSASRGRSSRGEAWRESWPRRRKSSPARSSTLPPGSSSRKRVLSAGRHRSAGRFCGRWRNCSTRWKAASAATRVYYLSTAPSLYATAIANLGAAGLADETHGMRRVVIEKPFGTDLKSAQALNRATHQVFAEKQVYRIDHYLGKETVQNLLVLRFANTIFEPLWNRRYIDHVQITVAEEVDVGRRGGILRPRGRAARHVSEPPAATADDHGDGGPGPLHGRLLLIK